MIKPHYDALAESGDHDDVVFLTTDVDDADDLAARCEISAMPTFQFYKNGEKVHEFSGASKEMIVKGISDHK